jgi:hypothetical protein
MPTSGNTIPSSLHTIIVSHLGPPASPQVLSPFVIPQPSTNEPFPSTNPMLSPSCHDAMDLPTIALPLIPLPSPSLVPNNRILTHSQTGHTKPKTFPDFTLYHSIKHPLKLVQAIQHSLEPSTYQQASLQPKWMTAMRNEFDALISNHT